jgi:predicted nucleic-acid-binding protein
MIGLDTNVLARYYSTTKPTPRRSAKDWQHVASSSRAAPDGEQVGGPGTRAAHGGYYGFAQAEVVSVLRHLLEQAHITVEDRDAVAHALSNCEAGIDFADALHHASYRSCDSVATFDDRKFARRAKKLGLAPAVVVVSQRSA